ncbi:MAG: four helix bundle protein [Phycisphaerae bacterium]
MSSGGSGFGVCGSEGQKAPHSRFVRAEDLEVYQLRCELYVENCLLARGWPAGERFELCSHVRRSLNFAPANMAEKHSNRHVRNKIEGVNGARTETLETIHHRYIAHRRHYLDHPAYERIRARFEPCRRMLNGLEKSLDGGCPANERRWSKKEGRDKQVPNPEPQTPNPR